ncbi:MAG: C1 family peptidase, partial [Clostridia bacterium]|nr:C1 family peptidase [Clostridia bacterium]
MKKINVFFLAIIMSMNICILVSAEDETILETTFSTGAIQMTEDEIEHFKTTIPQIIDVKPNVLFYERLHSEYSEDFSVDDIVPSVAEYGEEIVSSLGNSSMLLLDEDETMLPSKVDNSALDELGHSTFPEIGNQGGIGSCVGWSLGYYQLTNNANRLRGTVARDENGNIEANVYSPNWVYNLGNGGEDTGLNIPKGQAVLYTYGAPSIDDIPVDIENYTSWYPDEKIWEGALYNKCEMYYGSINPGDIKTPVVKPKSESLNDIKRFLADGYVVTICTKVNRVSVSMGYTGENSYEHVWTQLYSDGENSHALTIVGYDDNFKVDINQNGTYQDGEYGAFKIANSWGETTHGHNSGFIWLAYDTLNAVSSVRASNESKRMSAFYGDIYYVVMPQKNYQPLLTATIDIRGWHRGVLKMYLGIEDTENSTTCFEKKITTRIYTDSDGVEKTEDYSIAFGGGGNGYNLLGNHKESTGKVVFDFTPLLQKFDIKENNRYNLYIKMTHNGTLYAINTIDSIVFKDHYTSKTFESSDTPIYVNDTIKEAKASAEYMSRIGSARPDKTFAISFNSKIDENTVDNENIMILDSENNVIPTTLNISETEMDIEIALKKHPRNSGFYTIKILPNLKSKGGNMLN